LSSEEVVRGYIKRLLEPLGRPRFGFLTRDDDSTDVYFNERRIGPDQFSALTIGDTVEAEIVTTERGPEAWRIRALAGE
jgi:cold shock CspA family protein